MPIHRSFAHALTVQSFHLPALARSLQRGCGCALRGALHHDASRADTLTPQQQLAFDIYKELVEIDTVTATGDTAKAAEAMAARLRAAGFSDGDVQVFTPKPRKGNLVARLRGTGARKPILLLAHTDVGPSQT